MLCTSCDILQFLLCSAHKQYVTIGISKSVIWKSQLSDCHTTWQALYCSSYCISFTIPVSYLLHFTNIQFVPIYSYLKSRLKSCYKMYLTCNDVVIECCSSSKKQAFILFSSASTQMEIEHSCFPICFITAYTINTAHESEHI